MATDTWIGTTGSWQAGANWSAGSPPGQADTAAIPSTGSPTINNVLPPFGSPVTIASLSMAAGASLYVYNSLTVGNQGTNDTLGGVGSSIYLNEDTRSTHGSLNVGSGVTSAYGTVYLTGRISPAQYTWNGGGSPATVTQVVDMGEFRYTGQFVYNTQFDGSVTNFAGNSSIMGPSSGFISATIGTNSVTTNYTSGTYTIKFSGPVTYDSSNLTVDNTGRIKTTNTVPCFVSGTLIRVWRDGAAFDVLVEHLRVGDLAVTASGERRPIRWLGSRITVPRRFPRPEDAMPVRIRAHALGPNLPARDLLVSPAHSIAVEVFGEVLVSAVSLINGATVVQEDVPAVTYWHIELESHDLLVAENQPAESYLDMGNRAFFAGGTGDGNVVDLLAGPDGDPAARTVAEFCRPHHGSGPVLAAVLARLRDQAERLGWRFREPTDPWSDVHLVVDGRIVRPAVFGGSARFELPSAAREVWLRCPAGSPSAISDSKDARRLGLSVSGLALEGRPDWRPLRMDDPLLSDGFYPAEGPSHAPSRWTTDRARLPAELWAGMTGTMHLRVTLAGPPLPRWIAPEAARALPEAVSMAVSIAA